MKITIDIPETVAKQIISTANEEASKLGRKITDEEKIVSEVISDMIFTRDMYDMGGAANDFILWKEGDEENDNNFERYVKENSL